MRTGVRTIASWCVEILVMICLFIGVSPVVAEAGTCQDAPGDFNYAIEVTPDYTIGPNADGIRADETVHTDNIDLGLGNIYVESLYVVHDGNDFVEWAWDYSHPTSFVFNLESGDARLFEGVYAVRFHDRTDSSPNLATGNRKFKLVYNTSTGAYDYFYEQSMQTWHRDPVWRTGIPDAAVETKGSCDTGVGHLWNLDYHHKSTGSWISWSGTDWARDTQENWGYDPVSATEFRTSARTDNFTGCNTSHYSFC